MLEEGERVEADDGCVGCDSQTVNATNHIQCLETSAESLFRSRVGKRHKTFDGRIKHFKILLDRFEHDIAKHSSCVRACCVLIQARSYAPFAFENL